MTEVFIITGPVGIGKSSLLNDYFSLNPNRGIGFLCLKNQASELRELHIISQNKRIPYEVELPNSNTQSVGEFHFLQAAFHKALEELQTGNYQSQIAVVDELGKLEIERHSGFEPKFSEWYSSDKKNQLLVVVRSSLLKKALEKYGWQNAKINSGPWMPQVPELIGLVIAGGRSSRMGKDKKEINYHGKPQWEYTHDLLQNFGLKTVISASNVNSENARVIKDFPEFAGNGPISGLLTVSEEFKETALLVLGIDYPDVDTETLRDLIWSFQIRNCSVCYRHPLSNRVEPLIAIYHPRDINQIRRKFYKAQTSLSAYWENAGNKVLILPHKNFKALKSYDLPEDEAAFRTR